MEYFRKEDGRDDRELSYLKRFRGSLITHHKRELRGKFVGIFGLLLLAFYLVSVLPIANIGAKLEQQLSCDQSCVCTKVSACFALRGWNRNLRNRN
jgi:hypothetical protein